MHAVREVRQDVRIQRGENAAKTRTRDNPSAQIHRIMLYVVLQLDLTFHLFVCALAGAGAAVIAMVRTIILISDWL